MPRHLTHARLGWAIEPIIQKRSKESLIHTREATRQALHDQNL